MKNILLSLLMLLSVTTLTSLGAEKAETAAIVPSKFAHRDAVRKLAYQDPLGLAGAKTIFKQIGAFKFYAKIYDAADSLVVNRFSSIDFTEQHNFARVLELDGKVAGFVTCSKQREPSLEAITRYAAAQGHPMSAAQLAFLATIHSDLKRTDVECDDYAAIDAVMVDRAAQQHGHGKQLVQTALREIKTHWPKLKTVTVDLEERNHQALALFCKSAGFRSAAVQPGMIKAAGKLRLEKTLE